MDTKSDLFHLEKKTTQSLDTRFSGILMGQLTQGRVSLKGRRTFARVQRRQGATLRPSLWTRVGWNRHWGRGAWNFRNKYHRTFGLNRSLRSKFGAGFCPAPKGRIVVMTRSSLSLSATRAGLSRVLRRRRFLGQNLRFGKGLRKTGLQTPRRVKRRSVQARLGVAPAMRGRFLQTAPPTKKQLDAELDQYMCLSKRRLDQQLDQYMSLSKRHLDQQLDDYMALAGQTEGEEGETEGEEGEGRSSQWGEERI